jgi:hypothetical protein
MSLFKEPIVRISPSRPLVGLIAFLDEVAVLIASKQDYFTYPAINITLWI